MPAFAIREEERIDHWLGRGPAASIRWILKLLHDPQYLTPWELGYYSALRSCRVFCIKGNI